MKLKYINISLIKDKLFGMMVKMAVVRPDKFLYKPLRTLDKGKGGCRT